MSKTILFLHGLESLPGGMKPQHLESAGHIVLNPALPKDDFERSVRIAQEEIDLESPEVIVGSSRGGAVAMAVNPRGAKLVLIAPAWSRFDVPMTNLPAGTTVLHCQADKVVNFEDSEELASNADIKLIPCGDNHRMNDVDALDHLLASIE
tara:strand:- start:1903 stop:2355 length:453 start_codon:yes stop_codon:yes gene_type:complete